MTNTPTPLLRQWVRVGIGSGVLACVVYPLLVFIPMPRHLTVVLAAAFGPALAVASMGLYQFVKFHKDSVSAQIAVVSNILAGALVTAMLIVQLALRMGMERHFNEQGTDEAVRKIVHWIWFVDLGLDVSFDVFIGLGTLLFALNMLKHPRFGLLVGWVGIFIAAVMVLGFNFYSFPDPPKEVGLLDPGPFTGLWYLWVVILMACSWEWVESPAAGGSE